MEQQQGNLPLPWKPIDNNKYFKEINYAMFKALSNTFKLLTTSFLTV